LKKNQKNTEKPENTEIKQKEKQNPNRKSQK